MFVVAFFFLFSFAIPLNSLHLSTTPNISTALSSRIAKVSVSILMTPMEYDYSPVVNRQLQLCCHFREEPSCVVVNKHIFTYFLDVIDPFQPLHDFKFALYNVTDIALSTPVAPPISVSLRYAFCNSPLCEVAQLPPSSRLIVFGDASDDITQYSLSQSDDVIFYHSSLQFPCTDVVATSLHCCPVHDISPCLPPSADYLLISVISSSAQTFAHRLLLLLSSRISQSIIVVTALPLSATINLLPPELLRLVDLSILYESDELCIYSIDMRHVWYHNLLQFPSLDVVSVDSATSSTALFSLQYGINIAILTHATLVNGTTISLRKPLGGNVISSPMREVLQQTSSGFYQFDSNAGWIFAEATDTTPQKCIRGSVLITSPSYTHSISHMSQVLLTLVHAAMHPESYPWITTATRLLMPSVDRSDFEWNHALTTAVVAFVAEKTQRAPIQVMFSEEMSLLRESSIMYNRDFCFEEVVVVGSIDMATPYVSSPHESIAFREFIYKHLSLPSMNEAQLTPNDPLRITLLLRIGNRLMYNMNEILAMIQATGLADVKWLHEHIVYLEIMSFAEQVQLFRDSDIVISAHASSLQNLMFMQPHSSVIEIFTSPWYEAGFHGTALSSNVHYFVLSTTTLDRMDACTFPADCLTSPLLISRRGCFSLRGCNAVVDVNALEVLLWQASQAVRIRKRRLHDFRLLKECSSAIDTLADCRYRKSYITPL